MPKTPSIPQDVFFDQPTAAEDKPAKRQAVKTAQQQALKTANRQAVKQSSSHKVQVTVYLSDHVATELERARYELLAQHDLRVAKSSIVEYALVRALADLPQIAQGLAKEG